MGEGERLSGTDCRLSVSVTSTLQNLIKSNLAGHILTNILSIFINLKFSEKTSENCKRSEKL